MPQKRKRAAPTAEETVGRATRSTRSSTKASGAELKENGGTSVTAEENVAPATKRAKTTAKPQGNKKAENKGHTKAQAPLRQDLAVNDTALVTTTASSNSAIATAGPSSPTVKTPASKPKSKGKPEPYAANRAQELFDAYADEDDKEVIGAEGFERLCSDAGLPLDGALPLVLSWQLDASDMGQISREQWTKGTSALQISNLHALTTCLTDLENLLLLEQEPVKRGSKGVNVPYNREQYFKYADDRKSAFGKLYAFCFILAKQGESRNIQMDIASAFWSVLLAQRYPLMKELLEFIAEKGTYKFVTKDMWNMTWEFVQLTDPNLENYDEAEAWPTLIDEFVAWKKAKAST